MCPSRTYKRPAVDARAMCTTAPGCTAVAESDMQASPAPSQAADATGLIGAAAAFASTE